MSHVSGSKRVLEGERPEGRPSTELTIVAANDEFVQLWPVITEIFDWASKDSTKKLLDYRLVSKVWYSHCDTLLESLWVALQNNPPRGDVDILANMRTIIGKETDEHCSPIFKFKKLGHVFKKLGADLPTIPLPIRINDFQLLQNVYDKALETIWAKLHSIYNGHPPFLNLPPANARASEIRTFLNDPNNSARLAIPFNLDLSGLNLKVIPPELDRLSGLQRLNLSNNQLREVPNFNLPHLTHLLLNQNQLREVPDFNLPHLTHLALQQNQLREVPGFAHLPNLIQLFLWNNQLREVPNFNLPHLTHLLLNQNQLREVPDFNLPHLTHLALQQNQLSEVPDFAHLQNLMHFDLGNNRLRAVPNFTRLQNLTHLALVNNYLNEVPDFAHLPNLTHLLLHNNQLVNVPDFTHLPKLIQLYLHNNQLVNVPDFTHLPKLIQLYLHNNQLVNVPNFMFLQNLTELALSNNWLREVPNFAYLTNLRYLALSNNLLSEVPDFVHLQNLTMLFMNGNVLMVKFPQALRKFAEWVQTFIFQTSYHCCSALASLCQLILANASPVLQSQAFDALDQKDKDLILEMALWIAGKPEILPQGEEHRAFHETPRFKIAVQKAILKKFDSLSPEKQKEVYENIYDLAGKPSTQDSTKWGRINSYVQLPRLADALSKVNLF